MVRSRYSVKKLFDLPKLKTPQTGGILIEFEELQKKSNPPCLQQNGLGGKAAARAEIICKPMAFDFGRRRSWVGPLADDFLVFAESVQTPDGTTDPMLSGPIAVISRLHQVQV